MTRPWTLPWAQRPAGGLTDTHQHLRYREDRVILVCVGGVGMWNHRLWSRRGREAGTRTPGDIPAAGVPLACSALPVMRPCRLPLAAPGAKGQPRGPVHQHGGVPQSPPMGGVPQSPLTGGWSGEWDAFRTCLPWC